MRALLYAIFATIGCLLSVVIGYLVEPKVSMTVSLIVFLVLLFANFIVSWIVVIVVMNRLLADAQRQQAQLDIERASGYSSFRYGDQSSHQPAASSARVAYEPQSR